MKTSTPETPKPASPLKILLMGPPGSRKTTLMLQFPDIHVLDCDRNLDGPDRFLRQVRKLPLTYTYDDIRTDDSGNPVDIDQCYNRVCDKLKLFKIQAEYKARKTVGVDSLSHVNEFIIRHVLKGQGKARKEYEMEARDWSPFKSYAYVLLVSRLEETNKTIICTCHEIKLTQPDPTNIMTQTVIGYEPFFQGKVGDTLGAFFTDVWRLTVKNGPGGKLETWLQVQPSPKLDIIKNSVGFPDAEINITEGFKVLEPYLNGKL